MKPTDTPKPDALAALEEKDRRLADASKVPGDDFAAAVRSVLPQWHTQPPAPREWLVAYPDEDITATDAERARRRRGFLARGQMHLIAGEGGAGKGRLLMQLATCVAAAEGDRPFVSRTSLVAYPSGPGKVLLLVGEDDEQEIHTRIYGAAQAEQLNSEDRARIVERVLWRSFHGDVFTLGTVNPELRTVGPSLAMLELQAFLERNGPWALIILDPWSRFAGVTEENDNAQSHQMAALAESLTRVPGLPAVVAVAHTSKPQKDGKSAPSQHDVRGASSLVNAVRFVALLSPFPRDAIVNGRGVEVDAAEDGARTVTDRLVKLLTVKNNLSAKGDDVELAFHLDGGLLQEKQAEKEARRSRLYRTGRDPQPTPKPTSRGEGAEKSEKSTKAGKGLTGLL